jgi:type I restriction enzyme M protein
MRYKRGQDGPNRSQNPIQLEHIEAIEKRLWNAADTLRSNSNYASNEYFMPVMGLIFTDTIEGGAVRAESIEPLSAGLIAFHEQIDDFQAAIDQEKGPWRRQEKTAGALKTAVQRLAPLAEKSRDLSRQADTVYKLACRKQAAWLTERFPQGDLRDVEGLVKLVDRSELEANDWSLTPGRYVGVAPEVEDDGFDFEEALREIHIELEGLNAEAAELAARISRNFKELGI